MRRTLLGSTAALTALVAALLAAAPAGADTVTGWVTGVVTRDDATPLAGTTVQARTPDGQVLASTTTGPDGSYTLGEVPVGDRVVCADGTALSSPDATAGWLPDCAYDAPVRVRAAAVRSGVNRVETRATAIQGVVTGPGGTPAEGVAVTVGSTVMPAVTGADGRYHTLFDARTAGYVTPCYDGRNASNTHATQGYAFVCHTFPNGQYNLLPKPGVTYAYDQRVQPLAALSGRVRDADGTGVGGVLVAAGDRGRTTTAPDGTWTLTGLASNTRVTLGFHADPATTAGSSPTGYLDQCWRAVSTDDGRYCSYEDAATTVTTPTGSTRGGYDVVLRHAGGITGRVTDSLGRAVPDAEIHSFGSIVRTDANGVYRMPGLTPNPYYRVCSYTRDEVRLGGPFPDPDGYDDTCWTDDPADGTDGSPIAVTAGRLVTGIDLVLQGRGGITGRVLGPDGAPLDSVAVDLGAPSAPRAYTDSTGVFNLAGLDVGSYTVCFSTSQYQDRPASAPYGYGRQCVATTVQDSTTSTLADTHLVAAGAVSGTVTDVYGFAMGGVLLSVVDLTTGDEVASADLDAAATDSGWTITGLAPGRYGVCFGASSAYRSRDFFTPARGYASQCWKNRAADKPPLAVTVTGAVTTTGIDAVLRTNPA